MNNIFEKFSRNHITICANCSFYPCSKTEEIHKFLKDKEISIRLSFNGCDQFRQVSRINRKNRIYYYE